MLCVEKMLMFTNVMQVNKTLMVMCSHIDLLYPFPYLCSCFTFLCRFYLHQMFLITIFYSKFKSFSWIATLTRSIQFAMWAQRIWAIHLTKLVLDSLLWIVLIKVSSVRAFMQSYIFFLFFILIFFIFMNHGKSNILIVKHVNWFTIISETVSKRFDSLFKLYITDVLELVEDLTLWKLIFIKLHDRNDQASY